MSTTYPIHDWATETPNQKPADAAALRRSLEANGYLPDCPIVLYDDGGGLKVIDGAHRQALCEELGIEATYTTWSCSIDDARRRLWALNGARRNLTMIQRAVIYLGAHPRADIAQIVEATKVSESVAAKAIRKMIQDPNALQRALDGYDIGNAAPAKPPPNPMVVAAKTGDLLWEPVTHHLGYTTVPRFLSALAQSFNSEVEAGNEIVEVQFVSRSEDGTETVQTVGKRRAAQKGAAQQTA